MADTCLNKGLNGGVNLPLVAPALSSSTSSLSSTSSSSSTSTSSSSREVKSVATQFASYAREASKEISLPSSVSARPTVTPLVWHPCSRQKSTVFEESCLFAVPKKGRLFDKCTKLLHESGITFSRKSRVDVAHCFVGGFPVTLVFLNVSDIPKFVGNGNVDIGVVGLDYIMEQSNRFTVSRLLPLGFGKCRLALQAPVQQGPPLPPANGDDSYCCRRPTDFIGKRIVTSFPNLTKEYFNSLAKAEGRDEDETVIHYVSGSVEASVTLGLGDAVVDLIESGDTMRAAGLEEVSVVMNTEAHLLANPNPKHPHIVDRIYRRVEGYLIAQANVLIQYNIEEHRLPEAIKITPGKRSPTLTKLAEEGWVAISVMVSSDTAQETLDKLDSMGARDLLCLDIRSARCTKYT